MAVADAFALDLGSVRRGTLLDCALRASNSCVNLMTDLVHCLSPVKFVLDNLIGLEEALQLRRQLVVLLRDQAHVLVKRVDLALLAIAFIDLVLVLVLQAM